MIIAGIPTKRRATSVKVANQLAPVVDKVFIISQDADTSGEKPDNVIVYEYDPNIGLAKARNIIVDIAQYEKADFMIQSDDDITFKPFLIEKMIEVMTEFPDLGALSSVSRVLRSWNKSTCTCPFMLHPYACQLYIMRMDVVNKIGMFTLGTMEDLEYSLRVWEIGYLVGRLHLDMKFTHNAFISRSTKTDSQGGQTISERSEILQDCLEYTCDKHSSLITYAKITDLEAGKFSIRYNWEELLRVYHDKHQYDSLGYNDGKRKL
jgi:GT2 family glycosyltransferase